MPFQGSRSPGSDLNELLAAIASGPGPRGPALQPPREPDAAAREPEGAATAREPRGAATANADVVAAPFEAKQLQLPPPPAHLMTAGGVEAVAAVAAAAAAAAAAAPHSPPGGAADGCSRSSSSGVLTQSQEAVAAVVKAAAGQPPAQRTHTQPPAPLPTSEAADLSRCAGGTPEAEAVVDGLSGPDIDALLEFEAANRFHGPDLGALMELTSMEGIGVPELEMLAKMTGMAGVDGVGGVSGMSVDECVGDMLEGLALGPGAAQIMISYRVKDCGDEAKGGDGSALRVAEFLRGQGYSVFLDVENLEVRRGISPGGAGQGGGGEVIWGFRVL